MHATDISKAFLTNKKIYSPKKGATDERHMSDSPRNPFPMQPMAMYREFMAANKEI